MGMKLDSWLCAIGWLRTCECILGNTKGDVLLRAQDHLSFHLKLSFAAKTVYEHYFTANGRQARKRTKLNSRPQRSSGMILQPGDLMMGGP